MPAITPLKRMVFTNFVNNLPRIVMVFVNADKDVYFTENAILDSGSNVLVITKEVCEFLKQAPIKIKEAKNEISDAKFVVGTKDINVLYEKEKVYYSPTAINISAGINPIFRDFDVTISFKDQKTILEPKTPS